MLSRDKSGGDEREAVAMYGQRGIGGRLTEANGSEKVCEAIELIELNLKSSDLCV